MNINYLIELLTNRLTSLTLAKDQAFSAGDLERINALDVEIGGIKTTLGQLRLLVNIDAAAVSANTTLAEVVTSGIDVVQNPVQGPSASAIVNGYDISAYATDALHEQKIQGIVTGMPLFAKVKDVDQYIKNLAPNSPVTGKMVANASEEYNVDIPLLVAIMQNDSVFGTMGIGSRTNNPGNVGNTGTSTHTYGSWQEGVSAVAEWLDGHRLSSVNPVMVEKLEDEIIIDPIVPPIATSTPPVATTTPIGIPNDPLPPSATSTPPVATTTPISIPNDSLPPVATSTNSGTETSTSTPQIITDPGNVSTTTPEIIISPTSTSTDVVSMDGVRKPKTQVVKGITKKTRV